MKACQQLRIANKKRLEEMAREIAEEMGMTVEQVKIVMEIDYQIQAELDWIK